MTTKLSIPLFRKIASVAFSLALVAAFVPTHAVAAPSDADSPVTAQTSIASGVSGTCDWEIDGSGQLTIRPGYGLATGTLDPITTVLVGDNNARRVTSVVVAPGVRAAAEFRDVFNGCDYMTSVDLSGLDMQDVTSMSGVFYGCSSLKTVSLAGKNTSKATTMGSLFYGCESLESVDLSGVNTSNVTNMSGMFYNCSSLKSINLTGFDTSSVTNMAVMFSGCESLEDLSLGNFKTSKVTNMNQMFNGCTGLKSIDLSNFDTSKVENMDNLFTGCNDLERVTLGPKFKFYGESSKLPNADWLSSSTGDSLSSDDIANGSQDGPITFVKGDPSAPAPTVPEQPEEPWEPGSDEGLEIGTDIDPEDLVCVKVDDKVVDPSNYDIDPETGAVTLKPEYLESIGGGDHEISFVTSSGTAKTEFKVSGDPIKKPDGPGNSGDTPTNPDKPGYTGYSHPMYRLYNPNSGEHFYTTSPVERDFLVDEGWNDEGVGWVAPSHGDAVYRLYNKNAGEHHYTMSIAERDMLVAAGWNDEGIGWYSDSDKRTPLYRLYNPNEYANNHHYTTSSVERDHLISVGWRDEGVSWHGVSA